MDTMTEFELARLGRLESPDDTHLRRYPLTAETAPETPRSLVIGIPWYAGWGRAGLVEKSGTFWIPPQDTWGRVVGGHAIAVQSPHHKDSTRWWSYHDQVGGSCTGWSAGRVQTLHNRERYGCQYIYEHAQQIDEWDDTPPEEGSSLRAAAEVLRTVGAYDRKGVAHKEDGIEVYRWAPSIEDMAACLSPYDGGAKILNRGYFVLLQSWGGFYPHHTRMALEDADRVIYREYGECCVYTDR